MQSSSTVRNARSPRPGGRGPDRGRDGSRRIMTPSSGVNRTATSQDTTSAIAITANREKQYSPALLRAKPMGMKPAIVTRVPVSIGKAVVE